MNPKLTLEELRAIIKNLKSQITIRGLGQIKPSECLTIHERIIANADSHLLAAQKLSESNLYGSAIAHCILGAEEITKGLMIFLNGKEINLSAVKGYKGVLNSHLPRHTLAHLIAMMTFTFVPMARVFSKIKESSPEETMAIIKTEMDKYMSDLELKMEELDFWLMADHMKNQSLYVDFSDEVTTPQDYSEDDFDRAMKSCLSHHHLCNSIIESVKGLAPENLKFWRKQSNTKDFKETIAKMFKPAAEI
jgi:AbiV family abortive infection protein